MAVDLKHIHIILQTYTSCVTQDIYPFYDGTGDLITDKSEISQLLLEQFSSVFFHSVSLARGTRDS